MDSSSITPSPWFDHPPAPLIPLRHDAEADVCVIGAGVSGLSVAYELALRGASVVVLEQGAIGCGETANTTAHLVTALDERYFEIERLHGARGAALARESHAAAIDRIESIVRSEGIDCAFARVSGYIFVPPDHGDAGELLGRELAAARRAGAVAEQLAETPGISGGAPCLCFPDQAQLHPLRYLDALARAIRSRGGQIFTGTRVASIEGGSGCLITTAEHFRVRAQNTIIATNTPLRERTPALPSQAPFRSFVIAMDIPPDAIAPALYWDGYWDDDTPYHYVRLARSGRGSAYDLLIVGGEDDEITDPLAVLDPLDRAARFHRLREWAAAHFPLAGDVTHRWHGRILEPDDEFAFIGRLHENDDNVCIVSGDSGNGMTYAAIAGIMLPELIAGRDHRWASIYSPSRRRIEAQTRRALARQGRSPALNT